MAGFVLRMLITAAGLWLASALVPGLRIEGVGTLLGAAVLLGITNAIVRPLVILLTLPITVLTLGLFLLVVNGLMLWLVASFLDGFALAGLLPAMLGSIVVSLTGWVASWYVGPDGRFQILIVERRDR